MPIVDIPDRACPHCGGTIYRVQYHGKYTSHYCIVRWREFAKNYRDKNRDILRKKAKEAHKNSVKYKLSQENKLKKKLDLMNKKKSTCNVCKKTKDISKFTKLTYDVRKTCDACRNKKQYIKQRDKLGNSYVSMCIIQDSGLSRKDIPQELIELKRKELLLKRKIKNNG